MRVENQQHVIATSEEHVTALFSADEFQAKHGSVKTLGHRQIVDVQACLQNSVGMHVQLDWWQICPSRPGSDSAWARGAGFPIEASRPDSVPLPVPLASCPRQSARITLAPK
jgi:hypothetical protein